MAALMDDINNRRLIYLEDAAYAAQVSYQQLAERKGKLTNPDILAKLQEDWKRDKAALETAIRNAIEAGVINL